MKQLLPLAVSALLLLSCKNNPAVQTRMRDEVSIKGDWTLTQVTYPGSDVIKVRSFDLADASCMKGSQWHFISNNNKGHFGLSQAGCPSFDSDITWFINQNGQFVFKILNGAKAKTVVDGYTLQFLPQGDNAFQLVDQAQVAGKMVSVVYQFNRN